MSGGPINFISVVLTEYTGDCHTTYALETDSMGEELSSDASTTRLEASMTDGNNTTGGDFPVNSHGKPATCTDN